MADPSPPLPTADDLEKVAALMNYDAAVEAAAQAFYLEWDLDNDDDADQCRREMRRAIEAAAPLILAAEREEFATLWRRMSDRIETAEAEVRRLRAERDEMGEQWTAMTNYRHPDEWRACGTKGTREHAEGEAWDWEKDVGAEHVCLGRRAVGPWLPVSGDGKDGMGEAT